MKIYITGIAGLIGSQLARRLVENGHIVFGCDNFIGGYKDNIPTSNRIQFVERDITTLHDRKNYYLNHITISGEGNFDVLIHTAALAYEGLSVFSPALISDNIYTGSISVMTAAIKNKTKKVINCSSMARYGNQIAPFTENMELMPVDPYGMAKAQAEQQMNLLADIYGVKIHHVVPHNVAGPNQVYTDPYRNVLAIFANRYLQGKSVYVYGDGEQRRSFSHVKDCIDAIVQLVERDDIATKEVFNIGPSVGTEISILELAHMVAKYCGITNPEITHLPDRPREVKNAWVDCAKAGKILNYKAELSLEDTVRDTINYIKFRGPEYFNYNLPIELNNGNVPETWTKHLL